MFDDAHVLCALGGFLVLAHACYAVISYRDELKIAGDEFEGVPVQVAVECAIGAAMCAWGALGFAGRVHAHRRAAAGAPAGQPGEDGRFRHVQPPGHGAEAEAGVTAIGTDRRAATVVRSYVTRSERNTRIFNHDRDEP
jgi:hypothetical protein